VWLQDGWQRDRSVIGGVHQRFERVDGGQLGRSFGAGLATGEGLAECAPACVARFSWVCVTRGLSGFAEIDGMAVAVLLRSPRSTLGLLRAPRGCRGVVFGEKPPSRNDPPVNLDADQR